MSPRAAAVSDDDWRVALRLPGYSKTASGGVTRFCRNDVTAGQGHLLLHVLYLLTGVGVLCGARTEGAVETGAQVLFELRGDRGRRGG